MWKASLRLVASLVLSVLCLLAALALGRFGLGDALSLIAAGKMLPGLALFIVSYAAMAALMTGPLLRALDALGLHDQ